MKACIERIKRDQHRKPVTLCGRRIEVTELTFVSPLHAFHGPRRLSTTGPRSSVCPNCLAIANEQRRAAKAARSAYGAKKPKRPVRKDNLHQSVSGTPSPSSS